MKGNATFIEFATFFFIIAFSASMTKMQWDYKDSIVQEREDLETKKQLDANDELAWYDRLTRIQSIGIIHHDGDPNTNLFDVIIDASSYVDPDKDFISYSWSYSQSWDSKLVRNQIFLDDDPELADLKKVEFSIEAGIHEFELVVTDSYDAETLETVTIEVGGEPNKFPAGKARAYENIGN